VVHLAAKHVLDEMMSLQQLARACVSQTGGSASEPTLIIKTKSLSLKYILKSPTIRIVLGQTNAKHLFYGILVDDDLHRPFTLWSLVEREDELEAVNRIALGEQFMLALFNEAVVNICGGILKVAGGDTTKGLFESVTIAPPGESDRSDDEVAGLLDEWLNSGNGLALLSSDGNHDWGPNQCFYVTNQLETSQLDLVHSDEGGQQEQLATWITDSLHAGGVFQNPIALVKPPRELCDLLLTHEFGAIIFESKALSVLSRTDLPTRDKLKGDLEKHIQKALRQLSGACRNISGGVVITSRSGQEISLRRDIAPHCVIIVPDLTLLHGIEDAIWDDIESLVKKTNGTLNVVDPSQLFSLMMDSNNISHRGKSTTPLMGFDYLLTRRFESTAQSHNPGMVTLCRFGQEE
jgi:hypothetical protein